MVENIKIGLIVGKVEVKDWDFGENGCVFYFIIGGNVFDVFVVNVFNGNIYCIRNVDYEEVFLYFLVVKVVDNFFYNLKSSIINVIVEVVDVNDNLLVFEKDFVFISRKENLLIGYIVYIFIVIDKDFGVNGSVRYSI